MKKPGLFFLLLLIAISAVSQDRKKVAVVLSGGGAKGVAHIGALKVIEEAGIPIDMVVGTSMGAIVGGLYSIGYTPFQLDSMVKKQDWTFLLSDRMIRNKKTFLEKEEDAKFVISLPFKKNVKEVIPDGVLKGINLDNLFTNLTIGYHDSLDFNKLPLPFACVAVDLVQGKEIVFHSGRLAETMRASMAIPAAFTPVRMDSMVLVDGGLKNNFPTDVAKRMGAEVIIGIDVQAAPDKDEKIVSVADMVGKMAEMISEDKYARNMYDPDVYIHVNVKGYNAASFSAAALDTLTRRGEEAARLKFDSLVWLKSKIGISREYHPKPHGPYVKLSDDNPIRIRNISFNGLEKARKDWMLNKCRLTENSDISMKQLEGAMSGIYDTQIYTNISYEINQVHEGLYDLEFTLQEKSNNVFNLGIRFDTEEIASVLLHARYGFNTKLPTQAEFTGRFGRRTGLRVDYSLLPNPLRFINFSYMYQYCDINIYNRGNREYNTTYNHHTGEISYSNIFSRNLKMDVGIRYEYFDYNNFLFNNPKNSLVVDPEGFFSYYAQIRYESLDKKNYPGKGASFQADFSLYTDNLYQYNGHSPFGAVSAWWKIAFSPSSRFTLVPALYGRVLFGKDSPYPFLTTIGGQTAGKYVPQQLPFVGVNYMEIVERSATIAQLELRQRFGNKHYIKLAGNFGMTDDKIYDIFSGRKIGGVGLGYGYDSLFGPLDATFSYSSLTRKVGFYLNVGFIF